MELNHRPAPYQEGPLYLTELRRYGGPEGNRTPDLKRARLALSQLSYGPKCVFSNSPRLLEN